MHTGQLWPPQRIKPNISKHLLELPGCRERALHFLPHYELLAMERYSSACMVRQLLTVLGPTSHKFTSHFELCFLSFPYHHFCFVLFNIFLFLLLLLLKL